MTYKVIWHDQIYNDLKSIDLNEAKNIIKKINTYLIQDPISFGKPLKGEYKGLLRYRLGNYRIIYNINIKDKIIKILYIAHRKEIYDK